MSFLYKKITQDTKNQIINLIKITFLERIRKLLNTFLESIFTNFSQNRYISNLLSLNKDLSNLTINLYLDIIHFTNLYFRNSKERKTNYYVSKHKNNVHSYNEEEVNFSIFDNSVSLLTVKFSTNPISQLINSIAFSR